LTSPFVGTLLTLTSKDVSSTSPSDADTPRALSVKLPNDKVGAEGEVTSTVTVNPVDSTTFPETSVIRALKECAPSTNALAVVAKDTEDALIFD
jgi:hypothetical protein